jgi:hypothetical protein
VAALIADGELPEVLVPFTAARFTVSETVEGDLR